MANETNNYKLPKPEADDFYDISEYNKTMDLLDESLNELNEKKMDKNGDASEVITEYEQEVLKENIESGETLSVTHGKIKKWFSEMKDVAFSGKAKDLTPDAAHRFVTDTEKNDWNGKVSASGGDISGTVIGALESTTERYPVPDEGETTKVFMGKVEKFLKDIKPLDDNLTVYVANTGSDTTGDGSSTAPYKTITYTLSKIPNDLCGHLAVVNVADGTYNEDIVVKGIANGYFRIQRNGTQELNSLCNIKSILVEDCDSVSISGFNITTTSQEAVFVNRTDFVNVAHCQSISNTPSYPSFRFDYVLFVRISGCRSLNHDSCIQSYSSRINSENWSGDSVGIKYGIFYDGGSQIHNGGIRQPRGNILNKNTMNGGLFISTYGAIIGTLTNNITLYVSTTGSDITGNGTEDNPFKTIQYALDIIPKDLGGYDATVLVADGRYDERVQIQGYHGGTLYIMSKDHTNLNDLCSVLSIAMRSCDATIILKFLNIYTSVNGGIDVYSSRSAIIQYIKCITPNTKNAGVYVQNSNANITDSVFSNRGYGIVSDNASTVWAAANSGVNTIGIFANVGGTIHLANNSLFPVKQGFGGTVFNENGTQISGLISSGLSCTWGTIRNGYSRNGNLNGTAMVTVQMNIVTTVVLSVGQNYAITGFPRTSSYDFSVASNRPTMLEHTWFSANEGSVKVTPAREIPIGTILLFNATYLTNS